MFKETLHGGMTLRQDETAFRLSTDSVLLADFVRLPKAAEVCDLGTGCGTLGVLLCARDAACRVTGVEIQEAACALAEENSRENALTERFHVRRGDLREIASLLPANRFDCVVSNPPYFKEGDGAQCASPALRIARTELLCDLDALCGAAAWLLKSGGAFFLVHRPERLCDLAVCLRGHGLEPKRLRLVRHTAQSDVCLVLLEARRNGKPGLKIEKDLLQFHADGTETEEYQRIYHRKETKA